jgi:putative sterol carrier protein
MRTVATVMQKLPSKFQPQAAEGLETTFQFVIDEQDHYCMVISDQQCLISQQDHPDPDITLRMDSDTFIEIIEGELGGTSAFMSGRLKAEGNVMLATKLSSLFKR